MAGAGLIGSLILNLISLLIQIYFGNQALTKKLTRSSKAQSQVNNQPTSLTGRTPTITGLHPVLKEVVDLLKSNRNGRQSTLFLVGLVFLLIFLYLLVGLAIP